MNKYELLGIIGEGAYGIVIKARSKETNEYVAIKKFKEKDDHEDVRRCIYRELKMLKALRGSENIVTLKEAYRKKGSIYFVFEYVDRNMLQLLEEYPKGVTQDTCKILVYQLCNALCWCHSHEIIHRDVKPENLLISYDGRLKLCDFGFARKTLNSNEDVAPYTEYVATRWYRAPELSLNSDYGKPVDIWAVGAILGELSDGQPLFPGDSDIDQLHIIQKILGPLPQKHLEVLTKNPKFSNVKFQKVIDYFTLSRRYDGIIGDTFLDFMEGCLQLDPDKRLKIDECLAHRVFRTMHSNTANTVDNRNLKKTNFSRSKFQRYSRCKKANSFHDNKFQTQSNIDNILTQAKNSSNDLSHHIYNSNIVINNNNFNFNPNQVLQSKPPSILKQHALVESMNCSPQMQDNYMTITAFQQSQQQLADMDDDLATNSDYFRGNYFIKSKDNSITNEEFTKFSSKYNSNSTGNSFGNPLMKSPRESIFKSNNTNKYTSYVYGIQNRDQLQPSRSNYEEMNQSPQLGLNLTSSRQSRVQFREHEQEFLSRNTSFGHYQIQNSSLSRSETRAENVLKKAQIASKENLSAKHQQKRSKTSIGGIEMEQDEPISARIDPDKEHTIMYSVTVPINNQLMTKLSRSITQINTLNAFKLNTNVTSAAINNNSNYSTINTHQNNHSRQSSDATPALQQVISSKTRKTETSIQSDKQPQQRQINQNQNSNVINHFDRSISNNNNSNVNQIFQSNMNKKLNPYYATSNQFEDSDSDFYRTISQIQNTGKTPRTAKNMATLPRLSRKFK